MKKIAMNYAILAVLLGTGFFPAPPVAAQPAADQRMFASPAVAVEALRAAVKAGDKAALGKIFGPQGRDLLSGDDKRDRRNLGRFAKAMGERAVAVPEIDGTMIVELGRNKFPFPVPLVREGAGWRFDTAAGREALLNRRIGRNELHAIAACRQFPADGKAPNSIRGYVFKILAGKAAGEAALEAYPEEWGRSGVMTFIVDRGGEVFQRDLGVKTSVLAPELAVYRPDADWTAVSDKGLVEK
jgi:DUF2950 family protein